VPLVAASVVLLAVVRPRVFRAPYSALDAALCACLAAAAVQVIPLPATLRLGLSPALDGVDRALYLTVPADPSAAPPAPLSLDARASIDALVLFTALLFVFWCARDIYSAGGIRRSVRALAGCGLAVSAIALCQHIVRPHLLYGLWRPQNRNAQFPFGPFVNRNDFAAWLVLALPLAIGYFAARIDMRRRERRLTVDALFDGTGAWLAVAICLMAATLITTLSRSGVTAGLAGAAAFVVLTRRRMERRGQATLIAGLGVVALVAAAYANVGALTTRVGETLDSGIGGRREIWQATAAIIRDFRMTGVGIGAFERAMIVYQPPHVFAFNHAHDEYLQIAAEGGMLLVVPALAALGAGIWQIGRQLRRDRSPLFWIRAGAAASLAAIAVQSLWETGLRMPANAVLFALCAALAIGGNGDGDGDRGDGGDGGNGGKAKALIRGTEKRRNGEQDR
jgi:O-antigen ligase